MNTDLFILATGIVSGVLVFVIGRWIEKIYIDPIKDQKYVIAEIYDLLTFYAKYISNPMIIRKDSPDSQIQIFHKAVDDIRRLATKLRASTYNNKFYRFYSLFPKVPSLKSINNASASLIFISNSLMMYDVNGDPKKELKQHKEIVFKSLKLDKFEKKISK